MNPMSLFEREMREQVAAAEAAVTEAEGHTDPVLVQAARGHLDGLLSLARRHGLTIDLTAVEDTAPTAPAV